MRNIYTITKRELQAYFASPIAYVVAAAFLVVGGYFFSLILYYSQEATLRYLFYNLTIILLLVAPVLTMRLLAEEARMGTIELLLTAPVRDWEVVLGKFLASLGLWATMLALTLYYPFIMTRFGNPDPGPVAAGYVGLFLLGGALLSAGLFTSSLTSNQIVAAVLGFVLVLMLWLTDALTGVVSGGPGDFLSYLALSGHFNDFPRGIVDTKDVLYLLSVTAVFLFLSTQVVEMRRWK